MQLYKVGTHGELIPYNGQCVVRDGRVYTNPSIEMQYEDGFRPLGASNVPDYDIDTEMVKIDSYYYSEDGSQILATYVVYKMSELEIQAKTIEERLAALEQAGLERDAALIELAAMLAGGA